MKKLILLPVLFAFLSACEVIENFHEVDKGKLYRSRQMTKKQLAAEIKQYGIKTIINLRGISEKKWYRDEASVSKKYGVELIDIRMGASRIPHKPHLIALLDAYENAEKPILIHCKAGADRTGEAAAIYQMIYMNKTNKEAMEMLSPKYFHFEKFHPAKDYFIRDLWQGVEWAVNEYDPCSGQYQYYTVTNEFCKGTKNAWDKENISDDDED